MDTNKNYIIEQIDNLKKDIQNLINNKKNAENKFIITKYEEDKKIKLNQLKSLTEQLKQIHKREREDKQRKNDLTSVTRALDNLEFRNAKKNGEKLTKAKQAKEARRVAHEKYLEYLKLEDDYFKNDPKALPGTLFLYQAVIKEYGLCPYIKIDEMYKHTEICTYIDQQNITDFIYNKRLEWLGLQKDNGKLYYNLYDTLINRKELSLIDNERKSLEEKINTSIQDILTDSQILLWEKCINFIEEYVQYNIKTKRLKERFKIFIHNISILYSETSINIHKYLSLKYNCNIDVNLIEINQTSINKMCIVFGEDFDKYIDEYRNIIENFKTKEKFLINTVKNLKQDLCLYLTDDTTFVNTYINNINQAKNDLVNKRPHCVQVGKYFKRWMLLTNEERLERLESFAIYYVQKFLIDKDIIDVSQRDDTVTILSDLLKSSFTLKKMIYRDIVWNTTRGIIETVKTLNYDNELGFVLKYTKQIREKQPGTDNLVKKKISIRTVITKESEKIINEDLLYFIVKRVQDGETSITKEDKENFAERIKNKLKIKKLTINDKLKIFNKYDEIFEVVKSNKQ